MQTQDEMTVAAAQIAPVWGNRAATLDKVSEYVTNAAARGAALVAFGEGLVPGYPFHLELTGGASFDDPEQKRMHAHYIDQAVVIERGDLDALCRLCAERKVAVYLGIIERAGDRSGYTLYASFVYIDPDGTIGSVHRKLMPTYEERLAWGIGDGHGLRVHKLRGFTVGGLNCWENWMPMARASLYAQGEDLHVAGWPGGLHNTQDITRFVAREGRLFMISASGLMRPSDYSADTPLLDQILDQAGPLLATGGSAIAGPDGHWIAEPAGPEETIVLAELDLARVREERQNFDPTGHYSRPDVFQLNVNRKRQTGFHFDD